jgi:outer membrane murein-binding lipoprotein Lpp
MRYIGFPVVAAIIGMVSLTGCASKSDITNLQIQVDGLKAQVFEAKTTATKARNAAVRAAELAESADKNAAVAAKSTEEFNSKIDEAFKDAELK